MNHARTVGRTLATLTLLGLAWAAVTIASLGTLSQACRYCELGEL